jgi:hypothetical protein
VHASTRHQSRRKENEQTGGQGNDQAINKAIAAVGLLVLFAAIVLLLTGRYSQSMYDFVLGMNRWALRVAVYAGLMTDQYPPFRLDQGGREPEIGTAVTALTTEESLTTLGSLGEEVGHVQDNAPLAVPQ